MRVRKFFCLSLVAAFSLSCVVANIEVAAAQEKRSLFDKLFGRRKPPESLQKSPQNKSRKAKNSKNTQQKSKKNQKSATSTVAKPLLQKSVTAKRLLVIGDFIATHVADGLTALYADNPDLVVIKQVEAASGLVRDDYYNWPAKIDEIITTQNPDMMIIALGANDRQTLKVNGQSLAYGSEDWEAHYRDRLKKIMQKVAVKEHQNTPIPAWLGLPPFQKSQLNTSALLINSYLEEESAKTEARFIDIWRGFVDDDGNFNFSGYDANGQLVRLRTSDGINFTAAGQRKLAFYADEAVQALLTGLADPMPPDQAPQSEPNQDQLIPLPVEIHMHDIIDIPPQPLWQIPDHVPELVKFPSPTLAPPTPRTRSPQPGRADYFFDG